MTASILDSPYARLRLAISLAYGAIAGVGMWSIVLIMPAVEAEFGTDRAGSSLSYAATMIGYGLGNLLIGRLIDAFGAPRTLVGAALVLGLGLVLAAMAPNIWVLALVQGTLIGTSCAAGFGPLIADISHWFMRRRGLAVAIVASGNYLAGAVWPQALKLPLAELGWRDTYLIVALITTVTLIPLALMLKPKPPEAEMGQTLSRKGGAVRQTALSSRQITLVLCLAGLACCMAMAMPQVHTVALCVDRGYGVAVGAEMLSLMLAGGIVSRLIAGAFADRYGGVPTILVSSALQGLALLLYLGADGMTSLYVVSLVFGLSQGGIVPSYAIVVREYLPAKQAGSMVGLVMSMTILGMALGGWLSGVIYDATGSYALAFLHGIAWNVLNFAILSTLWWTSHRADPRRAMA